jgi:flagellar hook assembly protein FlgD
VLDDFGGPAQVRLEVLDSQGRRIRTLAYGRYEVGTYWSSWDGEDERGTRAGPGIYWARLAMGDHVVTRTLVRIASHP